MNNRGSLRNVLRPLPGFVAYVMRHFWMARVALVLTVLLLLIEYVVFSLMIPLASDGAGTDGKGSVVRFWAGVAKSMGLPASPATWLWLFLVMLALRIALGFVHITLTTWVAKQVHRHLSEKTFGRVLLHEPMTEIYRRSIGYYITLAGDDTFRAGTLINTFSQVLASLTSVLAGFGLLLLFSPTLLWWTLAFLVMCAMAVALAFRTLLRTNVRSVDLSREAGTAYIEALNGLRSIRSMASERFFLANYSSQIGRYVRTLFEIDALKSGMKFLPALLALLAGILVLWPGSDRSTTLTASFFFAATTLLMRVFIALGALVTSSSTLLMDLRAANDIDELIGEEDMPVEDTPPSSGVQVSTIELKSIDYGYIPGRKVLDNLNFVFRAGQTVAIVGRSGSGKSTLADMLLGLIRPDAGRIEVNGGQESIQTLRSHVILVEQQARIFSTSVRENLLLGLRRDDDALWHALRLVDLEGYVRNMPLGLDSLLDYQGANLSGGQRQRLGIARALVRDPQVLILDEATSALDVTTRIDLVRNLRQSMRTNILIFITHDESLAAESDLVLALEAAPMDANSAAPLTVAAQPA